MKNVTYYVTFEKGKLHNATARRKKMPVNSSCFLAKLFNLLRACLLLPGLSGGGWGEIKVVEICRYCIISLLFCQEEEIFKETHVPYLLVMVFNMLIN